MILLSTAAMWNRRLLAASLRAFVVVLLVCVGCGRPGLRVSVVRTTQGDAPEQTCKLAKVWERNDRPKLEASIVSQCTTTEPLQISVKSADGSLLAQGSSSQRLSEHQRASIETPAFQWAGDSDAHLIVEFSSRCGERPVEGSAECTILRVKDPPVTVHTKDPPVTFGTKEGQ